MGRGLAAILPEAGSGSPTRELPVELIQPNPDQPRKRFDPESLDGLARSIEAAASCSRCSCARSTTAATS